MVICLYGDFVKDFGTGGKEQSSGQGFLDFLDKRTSRPNALAAVSVFIDSLDDGAADDDSIGDARNGPGLRRAGYAEAHGYRHSGHFADLADFAGDIFSFWRRGAGDAGNGNVIEKSCGVLQNSL
jgi:hypothetical protein